ncbi:hypothetical protein [Aureimonas sp. AU20]|uniref:hypothetical protein n=1 Tax=Aureimonas sp. AU20 TaxID=1349819 RepID=UPI000721F2BC|nr:hypothetical protein [Aureimonas sp. AU20]ALN73561.1 hypothetical protein M673_12605 [Aureimonas sp. AU20]
MNMLSHSRFSTYQPAEGPANATIDLDVPMYVGGAYFCDFQAKVSFIRDETDRDGFSVEEMTVVDLRGGYPGKIVRRYNGGGPLEHDMACAILKEFHADGSLRRAEEAMKKAEAA